jgi:IS5 family transposase
VLKILNTKTNTSMHFEHIPVFARFQWLNNERIFSLVARAFPYAGTGRRGYNPTLLLRWLLYKHGVGCTYRDVESMSGIHHTTLIKFRRKLQSQGQLERLFQAIVQAITKGRDLTLIIDSSFVEQYARQREGGAEYSGYKRKTGFKAHEIIDFHTRLPIAKIVTGGARADVTLAHHLITQLPDEWAVAAFLGDKGYDSNDLVQQIKHKWDGVQVSIPVRRTSQAARGCKRQETEKNRQAKRANRNLTISLYNQRTEIERYFSRKKGVFHWGSERTRGIENCATNVTLTDVMAQLEYLASPAQECFSASS